MLMYLTWPTRRVASELSVRTSLRSLEMQPHERHGFTLMELLIVLVIIVLLATIAIPKFSGAREKAFISAVASDLRILSSQMEVYQTENMVYPSSVGSLTDFQGSDGITVTITEVVLGTGWAATGSHVALPGRQCGIFYGTGSASNAVPAVNAGTVLCN